MSLELGLQLFSVRNSLQQDPVGTLEKIAAIGYKNLEISGLRTTDKGIENVVGNMNADKIRKHLDKLGMKMIGCHALIDAKTNWDKLIEFNLEIGSSAIILPIAFYLTKQDIIDFACTLNKYGQICKRYGLNFYYHNHFQEFQLFEGQTVMDLLLKHTEIDLVKFELDTYWTVRGGANPIEWLFKLDSRCDRTHQKDLPSITKPVNLFDVYGKQSSIIRDALLKTQDPSQFTEIGEGILNIKAYINAMRKINVKYIFVEQDQTDKGEIKSIEISYKNLVQLLHPTTCGN